MDKKKKKKIRFDGTQIKKNTNFMKIKALFR